MLNRVALRHISQQTQHICITYVQRRSNVFDVGPTLYKCYTNVQMFCVCWDAFTTMYIALNDT